MSDDRTLTETLAARGYTHAKTRGRKEGGYEHDIACDGEVVFTGTASDVWEWLESNTLTKKEQR